MVRTLVLCASSTAMVGCFFVSDESEEKVLIDVQLLYEPCALTADCEAAADGCFTVEVDYGDRIVGDGMCTTYCGSDFDCLDGGVCFSLDGQDQICYQPCFDDLDCPLGFACLDTVGPRQFTAICLPY